MQNIIDGMVSSEITRPKIEYPLYRYRQFEGEYIEYTLDEIRNGRIHLSNPKDFNDPFDSTIVRSKADYGNNGISIDMFKFTMTELFEIDTANANLAIEHYGASDRVTLYDCASIISNFTGLSDATILNKLIALWGNKTPRPYEDFKIASFSEIKDSIPMWAYYGSGHKGLCLQYEFPEEDCKLKDSIYKVVYSDNRPRDIDGICSPLSKSLSWSHEVEWRYVSQGNVEFVECPYLKKIYLGIKFDMANLDKLIEAIKENGKSIKLYAATPNKNQYKIDYLYISI